MANEVYLGLDVGSVRIGVATARADVRIANPLITIDYGPQAYDTIHELAIKHGATAIVVGWPRGMQGQATEQTRFAEAFADGLRQRQELPVHMQDEALTSQKAEAELKSRNKPFAKGDVDALAATYILQDFLEVVHV
jgi:putative holliday junction resolvase